MAVYDPDKAPAPKEWLALPEFDRIVLIQDYHEASGDVGENLRAHACYHAAVENQIADGKVEEVAAAMSRLMRAGLSRHEAVHAVASILAEHVFPVMKESIPFDEIGYRRSLRSLTPESWRGEG